MNTKNTTQTTAKLFQLIDIVNTNLKHVTLTNDKGKNAVLVGEDEWKAIQETLYLNSIPGMFSLLKSGMERPLDECVSEKDVEW